MVMIDIGRMLPIVQQDVHFPDILLNKKSGMGDLTQAAKARSEVALLFRRNILVTQEDNTMLHKGRVDFIKRLVIDTPRDVDANEFRADSRRQPPHLDTLVFFHGVSMSANPLDAKSVDIAPRQRQKTPQPSA